ADFAHWRIPEQPAVLPAELRAAFVAYATADDSDIFSLVPQDASCLLETKLFLILQRAHARYLAEPLMKTGGAHPRPPREVVDTKRLAKVFPEPHDSCGNPLRLTVRLCHAVQHRTALFEQQAEQNLTLDHRSENGDLEWASQQANQAQGRIEQRGRS